MKKYYACALLLSMAAIGQSWAGTPFFPKLAVNGTCVLHKPADQITFTVSVITQADTAELALTSNNSKMHNLVTSLQEAGLEKGEYHTGQFSIQPVYTPYPKIPPPDWKPVIIGYDVTNSLTIKTSKLDLTPILLDAAGKAGASQITNINFGINDPLQYRSEAISQATANAIQDANVMADAANIRLIRVLDIKLDQPQMFPRPGPELRFMAKAADNVPFIEAPDVDISANVSITYEIASK